MVVGVLFLLRVNLKGAGAVLLVYRIHLEQVLLPLLVGIALRREHLLLVVLRHFHRGHCVLLWRFTEYVALVLCRTLLLDYGYIAALYGGSLAELLRTIMH